MFLYDKTNILEWSGIFEVDFAPSHGPANAATQSYVVTYVVDMFSSDSVSALLMTACGAEAGCRQVPAGPVPATYHVHAGHQTSILIRVVNEPLRTVTVPGEGPH